MFNCKILFRVKAGWIWWFSSQQDIIPSVTVIYWLQTAIESYWDAAFAKINILQVSRKWIGLPPPPPPLREEVVKYGFDTLL